MTDVGICIFCNGEGGCEDKMVINLKLCPFCGGEGKITTWIKAGIQFYSIECEDCLTETRAFVGKDKATQFWETRS